MLFVALTAILVTTPAKYAWFEKSSDYVGVRRRRVSSQVSRALGGAGGGGGGVGAFWGGSGSFDTVVVAGSRSHYISRQVSRAECCTMPLRAAT